MRTIAIPLRVDSDGQLERCDAAQSLIGLIRVIVQSSSGAWPHAPWFGLSEAFENANLELKEQARLADALNAVFDKLDLKWARVKSIRTPAAPPGERHFDLTLMIDGTVVAHDRISL